MAECSREWKVIDLGGSIVCPPGGFDAVFLRRLRAFLSGWLSDDASRSLALVVGGGAFARATQHALRAVDQNVAAEQLDWVGIRATRVNASLLRALLLDFSPPPVLTDYGNLSPELQDERVLVGGGWKPGFSTDYDSVLLARHLGVKRVYCLSNLAQVYSADPRIDANAQPLRSLSWSQYQRMAGGGGWRPGENLPFDPVATGAAIEWEMELLFMDGRELENVRNCWLGADWVGTLIGGK